jgi:hypothetical protein
MRVAIGRLVIVAAALGALGVDAQVNKGMPSS